MVYHTPKILFADTFGCQKCPGAYSMQKIWIGGVSITTSMNMACHVLILQPYLTTLAAREYDFEAKCVEN